MIIENGTIYLKKKAIGSGIDPKTGYPVASEASWGAPIPCQYSANSYNALGRVSGEHFTTASYTVLVEAQPIESEQLRLLDAAGKEVGEFSIISTEELSAVCETKILI